MTPYTSTADMLAQLITSINQLDAIYPNRFTDAICKARTTSALYDASLPLRYAANSKELRDTDDDRVHALCEDILRHHRALDALLRIKLSPSSPRQRQEWEAALVRVPGGKYAFRDDGSLEISLLDAQLHGTVLHVKRIWNHVCNFGGDWIDFKIKLDDEQVQHFQMRLAESRSVQAALDGIHGDGSRA